MNEMQRADEQRAALAAHLATRRETILKAWHKAVEGDREITAASTLSRTQLNDHIPAVLDAFERKLRARDRAEKAEATEEQKEKAAEHGLQRWHHGYDQRELMREWGHLHLCLLDELDNYSVAHPELEPTVMPFARRALAQLCSDGVSESAVRYVRLQQTDAAGRVRDLEQALAQLAELERQRTEVWREAAHDLRGSFSVVKNATAGLTHQDIPEPMRTEFLAILQKGVISLHGLLNDLLGLARLEAGQERRKVAPFDAAEMLSELCATMRPLAAERGLFLKVEGPTRLPVEGDIVMTQRIVQNLLFNALRYTERGGVQVMWAEHNAADGIERWVLYVQDTGPGCRAGLVAPMARAIKEATEEARAIEDEAEAGEPPTGAEPLVSRSLHRPHDAPPGEGIGLSIVKRLCELLDASVELETAAGKGTTFRVTFPRRYPIP